LGEEGTGGPESFLQGFWADVPGRRGEFETFVHPDAAGKPCKQTGFATFFSFYGEPATVVQVGFRILLGTVGTQTTYESLPDDVT
jgi:hypothetical protein